MNCHLEKLSIDDGEHYLSVLHEIQTNENHFSNPMFKASLPEFHKWTKSESDAAKGINLPNGYVPKSPFWLIDDTNQEIIGIGRIKHTLTPAMKSQTGHIAYAIRRSRRNKGYGNVLLKLLLLECQKLQIDPIQITVLRSNKYSNLIILKNNGRLFKQTATMNFYNIH